MSGAPKGPQTHLGVQTLSVSFQTDGEPVRAVKRISFEVRPGEILAIVGESGSGKTVSSRAMLGLLPRTAAIEGSAKLDETELIGLRGEAMRKVRGDRIAMIFQEPSTALDPVRTVGWQICEALQSHRSMTRRAAMARAVELMELVGIPEPAIRVHSYPHQLSGGQKQRVMIAMAISCEPELIIADEPTTALDVTVQAQILDLLHDLREQLGTAIILITHNMGVVADLADRVAVMFQGEIVEDDSAEEVFYHPKHTYTRHLLSSVPHLGHARPAAMDAVAAPEISPEPVLVLQKLDVKFPGRIGSPPVHAVRGVSLELRAHEILALVGESGSGKTTLGRCAVGLLPATSGEIIAMGRDISKTSPRKLRALRKRMGFVFQDPAASLNPRMSVGACISEPMRIHDEGTPAERRERVSKLLDAVELPQDFAARYPHELSGGQRQRVSLARALVLGPELLVADEPTSALDVSVQARVLEVFVRLQHQMGFACLFITHDLAVVDMLADRIAVMQNGDLVEVGTGEEILRNPQEEYTKALIAAVPLPDPREQAIARERRRALRAAS